MSDSDNLIKLLQSKSKLVAMLAPSFPIMYDPKTIVSKLKNIGFSKVVEVSVGAKETNRQAVEILKNNPHTRFITSPCASFVRYMRVKHPDMMHYLAMEIDSPMVATAKIVKAKWPDHQPVFIGPCLVKKLEASEDHPDLNILVLTYKELDSTLQQLVTSNQQLVANSSFDLFESSTRIYPIDGGLTDSSGARNLLSPEEIRVVSGYKNCESSIKEFEQNKKIRLLDILFCDNGCINGPGITSSLPIEERKHKIIDYSK
ncbi:MAG: Fe-S cluster domain protein [Candidatus Roizmanbacteria bacterium GW2011_GWA2_35_19]|uniref:Fe-S cluster domain protein n=2 Tax=Candidatus Roizmaniibacteriota TaxID=1752723 RepID=A0A0G0EWP0_9BACT|nr:MAG: Fe-S cluster domain protein [Candidatus Roizmanbacteria bacterium GW2011_GWC2_35_12]KKP71537.1 MAG: Fe-S cluster domain protein [Candidatus Roizmanbacteria bacterium GW2011_GWA2_35_19]